MMMVKPKMNGREQNIRLSFRPILSTNQPPSTPPNAAPTVTTDCERKTTRGQGEALTLACAGPQQTRTPNHEASSASSCSRGLLILRSSGMAGELYPRTNPKLRGPRTAANVAKYSFLFFTLLTAKGTQREQ